MELTRGTVDAFITFLTYSSTHTSPMAFLPFGCSLLGLVDNHIVLCDFLQLQALSYAKPASHNFIEYPDFVTLTTKLLPSDRHAQDFPPTYCISNSISRKQPPFGKNWDLNVDDSSRGLSLLQSQRPRPCHQVHT